MDNRSPERKLITMASNQLTPPTVSAFRQGRIHIWRLLVMLAVLVGVFAALLLIVASAV